jgi:hypothetical protein
MSASYNADTESIIDAIKARLDWRVGRDLSLLELRLDDEYLAKHYAEDVTFLLSHIGRTQSADLRDNI